MYVELDSGYWSKYRTASNPSMNHLSLCKGMMDAIKHLGIWETALFDLPIRAQITDSANILCDREFMCGLSEAEWEYVGNALVTLPDYPTPLFFFCAYPIWRDERSTVGTARAYKYGDYPVIFLSFGLDNFERPAKFEKKFEIWDYADIEDYDITKVGQAHYTNDLVRFDGNIYKCLVDGCGCQPWDNKIHWMPYYDTVTDPPQFQHKIYTAGIISPTEINYMPYPYPTSTDKAKCFKNSTKKIKNWELAKNQRVYQWRVEDIPYDNGVVVEYEGIRYKNFTDNPDGCSCVPMPYNYIKPIGCSGHWVPEYFEEFSIGIESPIIPIFSTEGREYQGRKFEKYIMSFLNKTLTFVDCTKVFNERGIENAYFNDIPEHVDTSHEKIAGYPFVSIAPSADNNLGVDTYCDYVVFGTGWVTYPTDVQFRATISISDCISISNPRTGAIDSRIINHALTKNTFSAQDFDIQSDVAGTERDCVSIASCAIINGVVDASDGSSIVRAIDDFGYDLYSDFERRDCFTEVKKLNKLVPLGYDDKFLVIHPSNNKGNFIQVRTNYSSNLNTYTHSDYPVVFYDPMLFGKLDGNNYNSFNSSQLYRIHTPSQSRSQLNGTQQLMPIWVYVWREPVNLDTISTFYKSEVWFACDTLYNGDVDTLVVGDKTYLIFRYLNSTSNLFGEQGVALLVDDREAN